MKKRGIQIFAAALSACLIVQSPGVINLFREYPAVAYADIYRSATVGATTLNVRSGAGTNNSIVSKLSYGAAVTVIGETKDSSGTVWYKIRFASGTTTKEGYASAQYIKFPTTYTQDTNFEAYMNQQGFPESYKDSLRTLHAEHPTWVFQAQKTNLDWSEVIATESAVGANLVSSSSLSSWKSTDYGAYDWNTGKWTGFDGATWVAASREIVSYYMDPRNFLNDTYVFQFLTHTYDSAHQTREGLQSLVTGTFLEGKASSSGNSSSGTTSLGPGYNSSTDSGSSYGPGSTTGPGAGTTGSGSTSGPGAGTTGSGSTSGPGAGTTGSTSTSGSSESGDQSNVRLEGPGASIASITSRTTSILSLPAVEYGPGMDASSITGDTTGASTTSPVPEGQTYVDIIMNAAGQSGVNPYVLGAMILQEQGNGTSGSISGKTSGYEGYYNFFNIGAYQAGSMSAVTRGLWYASQSGNYGRPWNSIEKSIVGGAKYYGENYVNQGQDTFYLKKFNVQGSNLYKHQYMTNVEGAAGEGAKLARAYTDAMKNETLVFKIPVYNNMPETACAKPNGSGSPNNKLSSLTVTGYALTPTFSMDTESYDIIVNPSVEQIAVNASVIDSTASVKGTGTIRLQSGNNTVQVEVTAENGTVRTYKLNVVRQSDAPAVSVPTGPGSTSSSPSGSTSGTVSGSNVGPGYANSGNSQTTTGPGGTSGSGSGSETAATPNPGGSQDVQVGVGPGGQTSASAPSTGTVTPETTAPTQAPSQTTTPPQTQAPTETTAAQTQAPAPETQAPTQAPAETQPAQSTARKKGDCNGDGKVTILDLMLINKQLLGQNVLSGDAKTAADLDGDGSITSADASALKKMIFGQ